MVLNTKEFLYQSQLILHVKIHMSRVCKKVLPPINIRVEYRNINTLIVVFNSMHTTNIKVWRL